MVLPTSTTTTTTLPQDQHTQASTEHTICYICQDAESREPLMCSPCGHCKMQVHQSCFDEHQIHQYKNHRCVVIKTDQTDDNYTGFLVYTSCSVCKTRYEYFSKELINSIAQHLHIMDTAEDVEDRNTGHRYATICSQFVCSLLENVPENIRNETVMATQNVVQSLAVVSADEIIPQIKNAFRAFKASLYCGSFVVGFISVVVIKRMLF